ncbi:lipopolysaccharide biosynthesis protein [Vibrio jasicida]|uniref:lipopolysaccharide biosynthesis protein n=1 Tax=Vibrio jasicida TaxID=766224 RepID=UPI00148CD31F|nr:hypothetical protein [Vibrio jasicida]NOJ20343.1 hypothetical protein [Vibrio jasicida]
MFELAKFLLFRAGAAFGLLLFTLSLPYQYETDVVSDTFKTILYLYLLAMLCKWGGDMLLLKHIPTLRESEQHSWLSTIVIISFGSMLIVLCIFGLLDFYVLGAGVFESVVKLLPAFVILQLLSAYYRAAEEKFKSALLEHGSVFFIVSLIMYFFRGDEVHPIVFLTLVFNVYCCGCLFVLYLKDKFNVKFFDNKLLSCSFKDGASFTILAVVSYLLVWLPAFVIENVSESDFVGYNIAMRAVAPITFLIATIDIYLAPKITKMKGRQEHQDVMSLFASFQKLFFILFFLTIMVFYLSYSYIEFIFEGNFKAFNYFLIISASYMVACVVGPSGMFLNMYGAVKEVNKISIGLLLISSFLVYPLCNSFGGWGGVIITSFVIFIKSLMQFFLLSKIIDREVRGSENRV